MLDEGSLAADCKGAVGSGWLAKSARSARYESCSIDKRVSARVWERA
jgi:hypothetical protein